MTRVDKTEITQVALFLLGLALILNTCYQGLQ